MPDRLELISRAAQGGGAQDPFCDPALQERGAGGGCISGLFLSCGTGRCWESSSETLGVRGVLRAARIHLPAGEGGMETAAL